MYASVRHPQLFFDRYGYSVFELEVLLNGKRMEGCVEADTEMGFVRVVNQNHVDLLKGEFISQRRYGKVELRRREAANNR